jgi:hypothetical protein
MDYTAFSHGQIISKQWLLDHIEQYLFDQTKVVILGGWYNILGLLLLTRYYDKIHSIINLDKDESAINIANKVCDAYIGFGKVQNVVSDSTYLNQFDYNMVINCSPEHMIHNEWFYKIKPNTTVILQSSNVEDKSDPWYCVNPNTTLLNFKNKYKMNYLFEDTLDITYPTFSYKRFMLIGKI